AARRGRRGRGAARHGLYQALLALTNSGPRPGSDVFDAVGIGDKGVPGLASGVGDRVMAVEDAIGELGLAEELPDVFSRVQLGRFGRQLQQRNIIRSAAIGRCWPAATMRRRPTPLSPGSRTTSTGCVESGRESMAGARTDP